ncbi:DNA polymerase I [Weissella hellenica]|uniref:DNA polymerase I n=1 Tax=Weissella hellenica TaxID=46256 RepID=A0A4Y4FZ88_WEIHE|nr:DNA polymerase I [Weissella hellenica]NKY66563.1 DNA polymerase I [Weissella hellenica]GED35259.1 DNA polymerase [Weissella hellenica]SCB82177.1 DNA polymerase I [Weissella hellenica]
MAKPTLLLIDGNSLAFRAFYALINQVDRFVNHEGLHTNALVGFNNLIDGIVDPFQPDLALVAWDAGKTTFRTGKFDNYKGNRDKTPLELVEQFEPLREMVTLHGIKSYELADYEADDIIGTMARKGEQAGYAVTIVTGDRDMTQLVSNDVTVWVTKKGISEIDHYTPALVAETYDGLQAKHIIEIKGLQGDTSDNYPGIAGIGPKTALKLIKQYNSIPEMYEHIDEMKTSKQKEKLINGKEDALMSRDLARIRTDAPVTISLEDLAYKGPDYENIIPFYQHLDFKAQLVKLANQGYTIPTNNHSEAGTFNFSNTTLNMTKLTNANMDHVSQLTDTVDFYLELDGANYHTANPVGFVIGNQAKGYFASRDIELLVQDSPIKNILENTNVAKNVFNAKELSVSLHRLGVTLTNVQFDLLLVSYLLDTNDNNDDLGALAHDNDYYAVQTDEEVYGKGAKFAIPEVDADLFEHLGRKAMAIGLLAEPLLKKLTDHAQLDLYRDIELPLTQILARMEAMGITVDAQQLLQMDSKLTERLSELEQTIYQQAGHEFNIQSPKQLGVVLFEDMGYTPLKKTKTGYSTSVEVLEKMGDVPIVASILAYRQIAKIKSTYVEGLLRVVHGSDSKVHTRYLQTLTQTGRLSSVDPNLQNIPVRIEEGRQIRKAFVPSEPDWQILSADYSQIELRVLAHITGDANLQAAFINGEDIHAATARRIFDVPDDQPVDGNIRRQAKAVNFGIVYGISDFGLSKNIGVSRQQAKTIIETYFEQYPDVKKWSESIIASARENGYVETIAHRRRYLPDINAKRFNARSFAERTAMNSPIQGSAADIIKIAMINVQAAIEKAGLKANMLLQVHDELIFEVPTDEMAELEQLVSKTMDSAVQLAVPLLVSTHIGASWYDAK